MSLWVNNLVDFPAVGDWRKRLGARLITERVQTKKWNRSQAASEAAIDAGTIRRIEEGGNYEVAKLERYAETFGHPLEFWLNEILALPDNAIQRPSGAMADKDASKPALKKRPGRKAS